MKKNLIAAVLFLLSAFSFSQSLTGYEIAKKCDESNNPESASYAATLTLIDKNGKSRKREVLIRSKDFGEVEKSIIVFTTPKDAEGMGYLSFDYKEKEDGTKAASDSWLYIPALGKAKRISGSEKQGSFMGTDFTYDDMGDRGLNEDSYELLGEEIIDGYKCYKLNVINKNKKEKIQRRVTYISKDNFVIVKCELYDRQDKLQRVLSCSEITLQNGYWTAKKMLMKNVQTNHSTLLELQDIIYDTGIDDGLFTVLSLERGYIK